jgi:tetratricopeptide (TPR) repeat protein
MLTPTDRIVRQTVSEGFGILRGDVEYDLDKFPSRSDAALAKFQEVLTYDPNNYEAWLGTGICQAYWPGKYRAAIQAFKRASQIAPGEAEPYFQLGLTFLRDGEVNYERPMEEGYQHALRYFFEAEKHDYSPKSVLYNNIGTTLYRMGDYADAINWFERSAGRMRDEGTWLPSTFFLAAEANEKTGRFSEAAKWYESCRDEGMSLGEDLELKIKNLKILANNQGRSL